jgi:predicted Zn-dependent peptidase
MLTRMTGPRVLLAVAAALAASLVRGASLPVTEHVLDNGLTVLLVERAGVGTVSCGWVVHSGSADDPTGASGTAHLFEHVLFKGSRTIGTRDWRRERAILAQIDEVHAAVARERHALLAARRRGELEGEVDDPRHRTPLLDDLAGRLEQLERSHQEVMVPDAFDQIYAAHGAPAANAFTGHDLTAFFITVPADRLELWFWLESDRLLEPVFRQFYVERDVVREERRQVVEADPTAPHLELFEALFWAGLPYQRPVLGWPAEVLTIDRASARRFFATHYVPSNITAVLVGDLDTAATLDLARRYLGRLPASPAPPPRASSQAPQLAPRRMDATADTTPGVLVRWPAVPFVHRDVYALDLVSELLDGFNGRLYRELVDRLGVASGEPYAVNQPMRLGGLFEIGADLADGRCHRELESALLAAVDQLRREPVDEHELVRARNGLRAATLRSLRANGEVLLQLLMARALGDWRHVVEGPERLDTVTVADIQRVATTYLDPNRVNVLSFRRQGTRCDTDRLTSRARSLVDSTLASVAEVDQPDQLRFLISQMQTARQQAPPDLLPAYDLIVLELRERLDAATRGESP